MVPQEIKREIVIAAPMERVWAALTEPEHLGAWFGDSGATVDLREGGAITMTWRKHGTVHAVIEKVDPPRFFSYRWARPVGAQPRKGNSTLVEFTLTQEGSGTRLRMVESGFRDLDATEEENAKYAAGNVEGWLMELDELREYLQKQPA